MENQPALLEREPDWAAAPPRPTGEQIEEILANFDFVRAAWAVRLFGPVLPGPCAAGGGPAEALRRRAEALLRDAASGLADEVRSGPLRAENRCGVLRLTLVLEEWGGL
jgi:hypothetical protein